MERDFTVQIIFFVIHCVILGLLPTYSIPNVLIYKMLIATVLCLKISSYSFNEALSTVPGIECDQ